MNIIPNSKWLVKDNKKSIRMKSIDVKLPLSEEDRSIMDKLILFVKFSQDDIKNKNRIVTPAVGLAAPQIGHNVNMYYIKLNEDLTEDDKSVEYAFVNPKIIGVSQQKVAIDTGEGCLSVNKQRSGFVHRSYKIIIEAFDYLQNKNVRIETKGYSAIVIQHEQDHLNGKLYYDYINKKDPWLKIENGIYL